MPPEPGKICLNYPVNSVLKRLALIFIVPFSICLFTGLYVFTAITPNYVEALQEKRGMANQMVVDRNGRILRMEPDEHGEYFIWLKHDQIPKLMKNAVIAAEDKRFYQHYGFDPIATVRAVYGYYSSGKIVSGASTISQQVVRMLHPRPRNVRSKIIEFFAALKLEWQLSKEEILELNLNLAPMGGYLKGVGIASRVYFDKDLSMASVSEVSALAALPRSPSRFDPSKQSGKALLMEEKDRIMSRMLACGFISSEQADKSRGRNIVFRKRRIPREASHFTEMALKRSFSGSTTVKTTLESSIQKIVEETLTAHKSRLERNGIKQVASIVVGVKDLSVLALMGSINYGPVNGGFNNGAVAKRSAGSTLKPFLYALAFEKGFSPASTVPDIIRSYKTPAGDYIPLNANRVEYGPVSVSEALGSSLNLSAVRMIEKTGVSDFFNLLKSLELVDARSKKSDHYGYGLAIGNLEVSLFALTQAYACLARHGVFGNLRLILEEPVTGDRVLEDSSVDQVTGILSSHSARIPAFGNPLFFDLGFPLALKTGTSDGFRDAWAVGYTSAHVIGVWAGNFNGRPSSGMSGASACGPILKDIISSLETSSAISMDQTNLRPIEMTGDVGTDDHLYLGAEYAAWLHKRELNLGWGRYRLEESTVTRDGQIDHNQPGNRLNPVPSTFRRHGPRISIVSPHDGDKFARPGGTNLMIPLRASLSQMVPEVIWMIDGVEIARTGPPYEFIWQAGSGAHSIMAVLPGNQGAKIEITVE